MTTLKDRLAFRKQFNKHIYDKTIEYHKKYGFKANIGSANPTWNNEADAFKHAFMQASLSMNYTNLGSLIVGHWHEYFDGRKSNQPKKEENMDLWNNANGREIAEEIKKEYQWKLLKRDQIDDLIADKIIQRMRNGELITHPEDKRIFQDRVPKKINSHYDNFSYKNQRTIPTGFAAPVEADDLVSDIKSEEIGGPYKLDGRVLHDEEPIPLSKNRVNRSEEENAAYNNFYKIMLKDYSNNGERFPSKSELDERVRSGELVKVRAYNTAKGVHVEKYYRKRT